MRKIIYNGTEVNVNNDTVADFVMSVIDTIENGTLSNDGIKTSDNRYEIAINDFNHGAIENIIVGDFEDDIADLVFAEDDTVTDFIVSVIRKMAQLRTAVA